MRETTWASGRTDDALEARRTSTCLMSTPDEAARTPRSRQRVADLAALDESAGLARGLLRSWIGEHRGLDETLLLASEIVTNAVSHGSPANGTGVVRLVARWTSGRIYVAVTDDGAGNTTPQIVAPTQGALAGRGLTLVDAIAQRWGTVRAAHGRRRVWFELVVR